MRTSPDIQLKEATKVDPSKILEIGMGFWASKTLMTAVKLELFTQLASQSLSANELKHRLGLNGRGLYDFLDALVAMGFLQKKGNKENALYSNSPVAETFLDKCKLTYMGGILEMANNRLYPFWNYLEEGLKTGKPQNEIRTGRKTLFEELYTDKGRTREFINAMGGVQAGNFNVFATKFDFSGYKTLCDIGGAGAQLSIYVAMHNPHMKCISFDLSPVSPIAHENLSKFGMADRVEVRTGDFFTDPFPGVDIITMGNILHDWGLSDKKKLISRAYEALPTGGSLVVIENIIDDERSKNVTGLLASLNMLIETAEGFDYTGADFDGWARESGFKRTYVIPLTGPSSAVVAVK